MFKRPVEQGRSERDAEAYRASYAAALSDARKTLEGRLNIRQWRKWSTPVKIIAIPCSSAALTTSASRMEPPGWMTAVMPACAAAARPARNGEKAFDAIT